MGNAPEGYNDGYPTCAKTRATLCIYPGHMSPEAVTERLGIEPTEQQHRGEPLPESRVRPRLAPIHGWFLRSEGRVDSRDSRRHIDWVLAQLAGKDEAIRALQVAGCKMWISCYWLTRDGHGGPIVSPVEMRRLGELGIELMFDFYH